MNDTSHSVAELVHAINETLGRTVAAYTFDAGPNACLFILEEDVPIVAAVIEAAFPSDVNCSKNYDEGRNVFFRGLSIDAAVRNADNATVTVS